MTTLFICVNSEIYRCRLGCNEKVQVLKGFALSSALATAVTNSLNEACSIGRIEAKDELKESVMQCFLLYAGRAR